MSQNPPIFRSEVILTTLADEVPDVVCNILPVGIAHEYVIRCAEAGVRAISCEKR